MNYKNTKIMLLVILPCEAFVDVTDIYMWGTCTYTTAGALVLILVLNICSSSNIFVENINIYTGENCIKI
jgi:hypothetical protein